MRRSSTGPCDGSVLVSAVVAMVVLMACGLSLAESFAAHRGQTRLTRLDERVRFVAEAGLWDAAERGTSIDQPTAFGGGTYTVKKTGITYISTGVLGDLSRTLSMDFSGTGAGAGAQSPLDQEGSASTAAADGDDGFEIELINLAPGGVVITSFSLVASSGVHELDKVKLDGHDVFAPDDVVLLPIVNQSLNKGNPKDWTIPSGESRVFEVAFDTEQQAPVTFTLILEFSNGGSSTIEFTVPW